MADEVKTPAVEEKKIEAKPEASQVEEKKDAKQSDLTLDEMKEELAKARREAAKYRTEKNKAESDKLTDAEKMAKDIADLKSELYNTKRSAIAIKYGLPEVLAARLKGETQEELEEDAKTLAALIVKTPEPEKKTDQTIDATSPTGITKLTREAIEKMTPAEINKNWEAVSAFLNTK